MTDQTELKRQIAALEEAHKIIPTSRTIESKLAALRAQLAARDAEPDWEAWRPAVDAFIEAYKTSGAAFDEAARKGLIAALPLAPRAVMDDDAHDMLRSLEMWLCNWRDLDLSDVVADGGVTAAMVVQQEANTKVAAIRATLSRVPAAAWPDKDTVQKMAARITAEYPDGSWTDDLLIEMARRLKAHMTGGAA